MKKIIKQITMQLYFWQLIDSWQVRSIFKKFNLWDE